MIRKRWNPFAVLMLLAFGLGQLPAGAAAKPAVLKTHPCTVAHVGAVMCGSLAVYEDRSLGSGRMIRIHFLRFPAKMAGGTPIFFLGGGPGEASQPLIGMPGPLLPSLQRNHDLIFIDQRGTGASHPLSCQLFTSTQSYFSAGLPSEAVRACRKELRANADLNDYGTSYAADDMDDIRAALGYNKISIYGGSYGSQLGLVYLRLHSDHVANIVLAGVDPPSAKGPLQTAQAAQGALASLFSRCRHDALCNQHFPHLTKTFTSVLDQFASGYRKVSVHDVRTHALVNVQMSRTGFIDLIRHLLYSDETLTLVPLLIEKASHGDFTGVGAINVLFSKSAQEHLQFGMLLSVVCSEEMPFISRSDVLAQTKGTWYGSDGLAQLRDSCAIWNVKSVARAYIRPIRSAVPTLMISGTADPATLPSNATQLLDLMPNAKQILVKGAPHEIEDPCIDAIVLAFYTAGSVSKGDTSCLQHIERPPFATSMPPMFSH